MRESEDILRSPIRVAIKGINDGFPGVNVHNPGEHVGLVDLRNEAVEKGEIDGAGGFDEGGELLADVFFVGEFGVCNNIDVWILLKYFE